MSVILILTLNSPTFGSTPICRRAVGSTTERIQEVRDFFDHHTLLSDSLNKFLHSDTFVAALEQSTHGQAILDSFDQQEFTFDTPRWGTLRLPGVIFAKYLRYFDEEGVHFTLYTLYRYRPGTLDLLRDGEKFASSDSAFEAVLASVMIYLHEGVLAAQNSPLARVPAIEIKLLPINNRALARYFRIKGFIDFESGGDTNLFLNLPLK